MAGKLGKFQTQTFTSWKGDNLKKAHLGGIFQLQPQKATNMMVQLLAWRRGKTLNTFLSKYPTKVFDSDEEYTWDIVGSARRNIALVEARDASGTVITSSYASSNVGANTEPFYLVFAEDYFGDRETIVGELNELYPMVVLSWRSEGTNTVYKVELSGGVVDGIPKDQLYPNKRFSAEYAAVEGEFSRKAGTVRYSAPVAMRNEFSHIRIHNKVSGAMLNKKIAIGIPTYEDLPNGKQRITTTDMWMHYAQWELEQQWDDYKNFILAYGRSNRNKYGEYQNYGKSGEVVRQGAGLFQQMEHGNTSDYNTFSLKLIEDALYELSASKLNFNERTFIIRTGERGALQFHKAVLDTVSGWSAFQINGDAVGVVKKTSSPLHQNALMAGFQFVEFMAPNGVHVKLEVDPFYDDVVRNKIMHPMGGPAYSYRYDIFDIGSMDQPNIFKVAVRGQEADYTSYEWGIRNPWTGQMGNPNASHDEDSATIHKFTTTGICVLDPTRTMSLIPSLLVG